MGRLLSRLALGREQKVLGAWTHTGGEPTNWWDLPEVTARWNRLVSGDPAVDYCSYVAKNHLSREGSLCALSLGCGTGSKELRWAELEQFSCIDAYDLSPVRIQAAREAAMRKGRDQLINFQVGDVKTLYLPENHYDLVLVDGSLHHFSELHQLLPCVAAVLKPMGLFVVNEYVGPSRFQWTGRQLEAINGLLAVLPACYKTLWDGRTMKQEVFRPSRFSMMLGDPSEAVESADIQPLLRENFEILDMKPYGGSLLHMLLHGIAHHFATSDAEAMRWLDILFAVEDALLENGELSSDFLVAVCRKRPTTLMVPYEK